MQIENIKNYIIKSKVNGIQTERLVGLNPDLTLKELREKLVI